MKSKILTLVCLLLLMAGVSNALTAYKFGTLTTPSITEAIEVKNNYYHGIQYNITDVSVNVILRPLGSYDSVNWFPLRDSRGDTTINAITGTSSVVYQDNKKDVLQFLKIQWVSKSGGHGDGTTPNISIIYNGIRQY